ncbi:BglG family transcription antiterminator [Paenibacillaceae bacterium WGS1546]|uniref:BglG family transcription antiterminator n=1 Tax=Cohnella sp. WGS1546 TaxID=3366810 RepID=UPI00372D426C
MKLSHRQRRILEVLLGRHGEVTAGRLAEEVRISARTVHRELQELEPTVRSHGLALVKKSGVGITLEGARHALDRFRELIGESETETYSPDERKALMLCLLLETDEPVKLFALAREAQAAIPTASRDLDELEPHIRRCRLRLIRRRGYGIEIEGSEVDKRLLIVWLAEEILDDSDWFGPENPAGQWPVTRRLFDTVGRDTFHRIERSLWHTAEEWLNGLKEYDYTRLLIRLSIAVTRIRGGHTVKRDEIRGRGERDDAKDGDAALIGKLRNDLELGQLPEEETAYLRSLFEEAKENAADTSAVILEKYGLELAERALAFVRSAESLLGAALGADRSLLDGLIRHLGPALHRLSKGEAIRNPLLPQIKKDYETEFRAVRQSAEATWPELPIPDEEIGYLTMHVGAALERWKLMPRRLKALLVCTSGIGSSKLLAVRITKEIPQIDLIGHYSWYEASRMPEDRYDLIISTVDLPIDSERYIKLSPLLVREEAERLRARIRAMDAKALRSELPASERDYGNWSRLKIMSAYAPVMLGLLESFRVYPLDNESDRGDPRRLLARMLDAVSAKIDAERAGAIADRLIEREEQGSLRIPDTELALYHTRSEWVREPALALFRLQVPQPVYAEPGAYARRILLMLAPRNPGKHALETLGEISAMLLLPELARLLEDGEEERIRSFIAHRLVAYIAEKMEWRDAE